MSSTNHNSSAKTILELEDEIQRQVPTVKWCFIEPDM